MELYLRPPSCLIHLHQNLSGCTLSLSLSLYNPSVRTSPSWLALCNNLFPPFSSSSFLWQLVRLSSLHPTHNWGFCVAFIYKAMLSFHFRGNVIFGFHILFLYNLLFENISSLFFISFHQEKNRIGLISKICFSKLLLVFELKY